MQTTTVFSFFSLPVPFLRSPILGGSFPLYISFRSILTFHLLIVQAITRVLAPSTTFPHPLWVAATKAILFKGPFIINAARTLVGRIKCGGDNFSLNCSYTIPPCASYCTRREPWPSTKWAGVAKFSGPTITPQNPTVQILGQRGGFW